MDLPNQLSANAFRKATRFIEDNANALQRARFNFHFNGGGAGAVISALRSYQNEDGGFGHGLEHDLRTEHSSVLCTTVALQILREIDAAPADIIEPAMAYLVASYRQGNWGLITSECNDAPHAPWWRFRPGAACSRLFLANPGAEIIGYLLDHPSEMPMDEIEALLARAIDHAGKYQLDMHELQCYLRLFETRALPDEARRELLPLVVHHAFMLVENEPGGWEEYALTPLDVAQSRDKPLAKVFGDSLDTALTHSILTQEGNGAWRPSWSWGEMFPATWQVVETEIMVDLTIDRLRRLRAFNRICFVHCVAA